MSSADAHLYGIRKPKNTHKEISSSTTLAFTSQLSSLISSTPTDPTTKAPRSRLAAGSRDQKDSIFTSHNRGASKRAARDLADDDDDTFAQKHKRSADLGADGDLDDHTRHRARRKMEEKARLYAAMKRGDYVASSSSKRRGDEYGEDPKAPLVDFDKKWADKEAQRQEGGKGEGSEDSSSGDDNGSDSDDGAEVEYQDEFGRTRRGTRADARRMERRRQNLLLGQEELERASARPKAPEQVIYGDTIQYGAFNPEESVAEKMAELAAARDRSPTPPPPVHYDASHEIRTRGVGFYQFSADEATRSKEMEELAKEREETERRRRERAEAKEKRKKEIEERRKMVREKRAKREADRFLDGLDMGTNGEAEE